MVECLTGPAQPILLDAHELRQAEAQSGIVAECAEIAQMIGNTLAFEHECAQPGGACRWSDI